MKYILIGIVLIIMLINKPNTKTQITAITASSSILAFGDSLTHGYGANPQQSYPNILSSLTGLNIINAGVNGDTSDEGLARLDTFLLDTYLEDKNIKLMLLCFGGNDIIQRKSMDTLKSNLKSMIHMAKEKNIEVLLISVPNISLFGLSPLSLYEDIAEEENIPLASGILSDILGNPSYKSDQIHPNALGYKVMAEKIYESLREEGFIE